MGSGSDSRSVLQLQEVSRHLLQIKMVGILDLPLKLGSCRNPPGANDSFSWYIGSPCIQLQDRNAPLLGLCVFPSRSSSAAITYQVVFVHFWGWDCAPFIPAPCFSGRVVRVWARKANRSSPNDQRWMHTEQTSLAKPGLQPLLFLLLCSR